MVGILGILCLMIAVLSGALAGFSAEEKNYEWVGAFGAAAISFAVLAAGLVLRVYAEGV